MLDPYTQPTSLDDDAFRRADLYAAAVASYQIQGLPGRFFPQLSWSNLPEIDLGDPFGALSPGLVKDAVGALVGASSTAGLPVNHRDSTRFLISPNWSQYLLVKDDPATIDEKLKTGQALRGVGIFARASWGPGAGTSMATGSQRGFVREGLMDQQAV